MEGNIHISCLFNVYLLSLISPKGTWMQRHLWTYETIPSLFYRILKWEKYVFIILFPLTKWWSKSWGDSLFMIPVDRSVLNYEFYPLSLRYVGKGGTYLPGMWWNYFLGGPRVCFTCKEAGWLRTMEFVPDPVQETRGKGRWTCLFVADPGKGGHVGNGLHF